LRLNLIQKTTNFLILIFLFLNAAFSSTIGIATGNKTVDGRPLLFKNRDRTDAYPPDVQHYEGNSVSGEFSFVFQKNLNQTSTRVRMGINSVGFGIGNTDSENLSGAGTGLSNSEFLSIAIRTCANIQDFRDFLDDTNGARDVHAHIGVIDSSGAGSLFEVDGYTWFEFPVIDSFATMANTAKYHPSAGPPASGSTSPEREARVLELFRLIPPGQLDYKYFIQEIMKDFSLNQAIENSMPIGQYRTNPVVSRYKTLAGAVLRGCKTGDDPLVESAMWLTLGEPSLSIALPFFPNVDEVFQFIRPVSQGEGLAGSSDNMRRLVYDYTNGRYHDQYVDTNLLIDIRNYSFPLQDEIFQLYENKLVNWRSLDQSQTQDSMKVWTNEIQLFGKTQYEAIWQIMRIDSSLSHSYAPHQIMLSPNYPNPFNSSTIIRYYLPKNCEVSFRILNVVGREMWKMNLGKQTAGWQQIHFFPESINGQLTAGIYFYQIKAGGYNKFQKMVYLP
jgi:hypothetical protein